MKVEAIKREDGVWLPMLDVFKHIHHKTIWLEVEILESAEQSHTEEYAALDSLIGLCETGRTDASTQHDAIIYAKKETSA